jgi:arsenate reductase
MKHRYCKTASNPILLDHEMSDQKLVIYHNPQCSKSRETLQILKDHDSDPHIVEYLQQPPDADELKRIIDLLGVSARDLLRTTEAAYVDAGLDRDSLSENEIIEALCKFPSVLQRPIVVSGNKAVIGRPPSKVLVLLQHDN